jgi:hypothetical protein
MVLEQAKALTNKGQEPPATKKPESYLLRAGGTVAHGAKPLSEVMMARFGNPTGRVQPASAH